MKTIRWFGALGLALVTAAGIAILTSDAQAQYVRLFPGNARLMTAAEAARVLQAINQCWTHPNGTVRIVRLYRGEGADASNLFADITGESKHTREEARALLRAGEHLPPGLAKSIAPVERCQITGAPRQRAVEDIAQALWPYSFDTWRSSSFVYSPSARTLTCIDTRGAIGLSEDAVLTAIENGEDIQLEGVIE